jgi:uncharacterized membrane protein
MKKHLQWLQNEIEIWVRAGIIDDRQARAIRGHYPSQEESASWGRIAFGVAGGVLIGLGVILLFAYNWEKMHKFAKLAVVFTALIAAHGAALSVKRAATRETLHVLGTMFFGAGIWLIAQIYHIDEHYPNAFLVWGIGALSLAWVLPSLSQALIASFLLVLWNGFEVFNFHNPNHVAPALILLGVIPLAWVLRSRVLTAAGLAAFLFVLFFTLQRVSWNLMIPVFLSCAAVLIAAGLILQRNDRATELAPTCFFFGNGLYFFLLYLLTFRGTRETLSLSSHQPWVSGLWVFLPLVVALGLWVAALWPVRDIRERISGGMRVDYLAVPVTLLVYALLSLYRIELRGFLATAPYNLLFLFSAVMLMLRGFRTLHLRSAALGSALLAALAIARYTDLFHSLLARAAVFLLVGGMMLGVGIFFARARKARQEGTR